MKTEAYICDFCGNLKESPEIIGISTQQDAFEKMKSFPPIYIPAKAEIHHCLTCYNNFVVSFAERETNRKEDENAYKLKLNEMYYMLRSQCVEKFNKKRLSKTLKGRKKG